MVREGVKSGSGGSVLTGAAPYLQKFARFVEDMQEFRADEFLRPVPIHSDEDTEKKDKLLESVAPAELDMDRAPKFLCLLAAMLCGSSTGVPAVPCPAPKNIKAAIFKNGDKVFMAFFPPLNFVTVVTQPLSGARELVVATVRTIQLRPATAWEGVTTFIDKFSPWIRGGGAGVASGPIFRETQVDYEEEELFLEPVVTTWDSGVVEWAPTKIGSSTNNVVVNLADFLCVMPTSGKDAIRHVIVLKGPDVGRPVPGALAQVTVVVPSFTQRRVMGVPPPPGFLFSFGFASGA